MSEQPPETAGDYRNPAVPLEPPPPPVPMVQARPILPFDPNAPTARAIRLDPATGLPEVSPESWPPSIPRWRAVLELVGPAVGGYLGFLAGAFVFQFLKPADPRWTGPCSSFFMGFGALAGCFIVLAITRQSPIRIGLTTRHVWANIGIGLGSLTLFYVLLYTVILTLVLIWPEIGQQESTAQKAVQQTFPPMSFALLIPMMGFVGFWEETVFRGFVQTRLYALFRRWWLAIAAGSVFFGLIHAYEGVLAMLLITVIAVIMSVLFVWRRSLVPGIAFHVVHNVFMFSILQSAAMTP